jgi:ribosomal protein S3
MATVTTKFGVCSIKVWILYEPTNTLPLFIDK